MNLLLRERAALRNTRQESEGDVTQAEQWSIKAIEIKRWQNEGAGTPFEMANPLTSTPPHSIPTPPELSAFRNGSRIGAAVEQANLVTKVDPVYPLLAMLPTWKVQMRKRVTSE